ncbi:hypothetical protein M0802_009406 [Mischocyttarus mexicanus]|nr:hypothetical protein M0802_009406 [Mischocyttarus mexicanus]
MNAFSENPFFFFVDNANPIFPMDVHQDAGKIIELSDTGCDAISPSSSIGPKNDANQSYLKKTLCLDDISFRKGFEEKQETNREELRKKKNSKSKVLPKDKTLLGKEKRKELTKERSKMINTEVNGKIDQRNNADLENILLREERNFANDSTLIDLTFFNDENYSTNKEPNFKKKKEENEMRRKMSDSYKNWNESKSTARLSRTPNSNVLEKENKEKRISSASRRSSQKQKENMSTIVSDDVTDKAKIKTSLEDKSTDSNCGEIRKTIDRGVDKDTFGIFAKNMQNNNNNNNDNKGKSRKEENVERSKQHFNRQFFNRQMDKKTASEMRAIPKSADFDKSKHRANMQKRYANKSWIKFNRNNSMIPKSEEKESFSDKEDFHKGNNDYLRSRVISNSAGSSSRRVEEIQKEKMKLEKKIDMASSFDDNSDTWNKSKNNLNERSRNTNRISENSLPRSVREEGNNDKVGIKKEDLEQIGAIFLASSLRKSGKLVNSKTTDNDDHNSKNNKSAQLEKSKMEKGQLDRMLFSSKICPMISNLSKLPSKTEKPIKSKIPIAIFRIKKELEDNLGSFKLQDGNRPRSKSIVTETDKSKEKKIDESTSTAIILVDKSDCTRDEDNEKDDCRVGTRRLNSLSKKVEESRKRKLDVQLKVLKMANDVKEKRRQQFEKCALREPLKKFINESQEVVDIAVTILEKDSKGEKKSSNADRRLENEVYSKPYSLRSGMYSKYLPNYFPSKRYRT